MHTGWSTIVAPVKILNFINEKVWCGDHMIYCKVKSKIDVFLLYYLLVGFSLCGDHMTGQVPKLYQKIELFRVTWAFAGHCTLTFTEYGLHFNKLPINSFEQLRLNVYRCTWLQTRSIHLLYETQLVVTCDMLLETHLKMALVKRSTYSFFSQIMLRSNHVCKNATTLILMYILLPTEFLSPVGSNQKNRQLSITRRKIIIKGINLRGQSTDLIFLWKRITLSSSEPTIWQRIM
jgi:hypothetical protein